MRIWQRAITTCLLSGTVLQSFAAIDIQVMNPDGTPASDIVVFAVSDTADYPDTLTQTINIAQKDKLFQPYITVMQRQDTAQFVNQDNFTHHIYSLSEGNRFSFKLRAGQHQTLELKNHGDAFEQVAMGCNIHDWMSGFLLILDTPYFSRTDSQGHASLTVANGDYQLHLWHPDFNNDDHSYRRNISYPQTSSLNWQLKEQLVATEPEANDDDFEFLDEY